MAEAQRWPLQDQHPSPPALKAEQVCGYKVVQSGGRREGAGRGPARPGPPGSHRPFPWQRQRPGDTRTCGRAGRQRLRPVPAPLTSRAGGGVGVERALAVPLPRLSLRAAPPRAAGGGGARRGRQPRLRAG